MAQKAQFDSSRRLIVLVPGLARSKESWNELIDALKQRIEQAGEIEPESITWMPWNHGLTSLTKATFSRIHPKEIAIRLQAAIDERVRTELLEPGGGFEEIILVGHSMGGVLVRQAYLLSAKQDRIDYDGTPWWTKVDRIILLGSPNRGYDPDTFQQWKVLRFFPEPLIRFLVSAALFFFDSYRRPPLVLLNFLKGSAFITDMRLQWVNLFEEFRKARNTPARRELGAAFQPKVIQVLGDRDVLVTGRDSQDLEYSSAAHQIFLPESDHGHLMLLNHLKGDARNRRVTHFYQLFFQRDLTSLLESPDLSPRQERKTEKTHVILVLHGIRDSNNDWVEGFSQTIHDEFKKYAELLPQSEIESAEQSQFDDALGLSIKTYNVDQVANGRKKKSPEKVNIRIYTPSYGYFSLLKFAFPYSRRSRIRWFRDVYAYLYCRMPDARFHFVGHSNGTYLMGESLRTVSRMRFDQVYLAGCALPQDFEWREILAKYPGDPNARVGRVRNDRSYYDYAIGLAVSGLSKLPLIGRLWFSDIGPSGFDGFLWKDEMTHEVYYYSGGHGEPLGKHNRASVAHFLAEGIFGLKTSFRDHIDLTKLFNPDDPDAPEANDNSLPPERRSLPARLFENKAGVYVFRLASRLAHYLLLALTLVLGVIGYRIYNGAELFWFISYLILLAVIAFSV